MSVMPAVKAIPVVPPSAVITVASSVVSSQFVETPVGQVAVAPLPGAPAPRSRGETALPGAVAPMPAASVSRAVGWAKNSRSPTVVSTDRKAQMSVTVPAHGLALQTQTTQRFPNCGTIPGLRPSTPDAQVPAQPSVLLVLMLQWWTLPLAPASAIARSFTAATSNP